MALTLSNCIMIFMASIMQKSYVQVVAKPCPWNWYMILFQMGLDYHKWKAISHTCMHCWCFFYWRKFDMPTTLCAWNQYSTKKSNILGVTQTFSVIVLNCMKATIESVWVKPYFVISRNTNIQFCWYSIIFPWLQPRQYWWF